MTAVGKKSNVFCATQTGAEETAEPLLFWSLSQSFLLFPLVTTCLFLPYDLSNLVFSNSLSLLQDFFFFILLREQQRSVEDTASSLMFSFLDSFLPDENGREGSV